MPRLAPGSCNPLQAALDLSDDHFDRDRVVTSSRHDHVGVPLARLDELQMHRLHGREILLDHVVERASAYMRVALDAPDEPHIGLGIDEHLHIAQLAQPLIDEQQNPVDDDDIGRLDARVLARPEVRDEIIFRLVDRVPRAKCFEMLAEEVEVERIGMVPVQLPALIERQRSEIPVIRIHVDERDRRCRQQVGDVARDGGFPRPGSSGDPDYERLQHEA